MTQPYIMTTTRPAVDHPEIKIRIKGLPEAVQAIKSCDATHHHVEIFAGITLGGFAQVRTKTVPKTEETSKMYGYTSITKPVDTLIAGHMAPAKAIRYAILHFGPFQEAIQEIQTWQIPAPPKTFDCINLTETIGTTITEARRKAAEGIPERHVRRIKEAQEAAEIKTAGSLITGKIDEEEIQTITEAAIRGETHPLQVWTIRQVNEATKSYPWIVSELVRFDIIGVTDKTFKTGWISSDGTVNVRGYVCKDCVFAIAQEALE